RSTYTQVHSACCGRCWMVCFSSDQARKAFRYSASDISGAAFSDGLSCGGFTVGAEAYTIGANNIESNNTKLVTTRILSPLSHTSSSCSALVSRALATQTPVAALMKCSMVRPSESTTTARIGRSGANFSHTTIVRISTTVNTITRTTATFDSFAPSRVMPLSPVFRDRQL